MFLKQNINIAEILKDAPSGTSLYTPLLGFVELVKVIINKNYSSIKVEVISDRESFDDNSLFYYFNEYGKYTNSKDAECMLFPSKNNRDWSTFKAPWKLKKFTAGQKVLVGIQGLTPDGSSYHWTLSIYSHFVKGGFMADGQEYNGSYHVCINGRCYPEELIIPYEGNEDKLGKEVNLD